MYSYGPQLMAKQKQDDQLEHIYSSYVRIRDVALKTYQKRWIIERSVERWSGISVLAARHDIYIYIYIYIYICHPRNAKALLKNWVFWYPIKQNVNKRRPLDRRYISWVDVCRLLAEGLDTKSTVKFDGFRFQLEASCVSSYTEEL